MYHVAVDIPAERQWIGLNQMFIVPKDRVSSFLEDVMTAMAEASRKHGVAMIGGETAFLDGPPPGVPTDRAPGEGEG